MSWIQAQEERDYDTQTEWLAVMRADHFDPYEFFVECEIHENVSYDIREGCPEFHEPVEPSPEASSFWMDPADEPPF